MPFRVCQIGMVFVTLLALAGCGGSKSSDLVVRGQVLYRGEPVSGGLIVFAPDAERGSNGPLVTAILNQDGSFTVSSPHGKPVPAGWYTLPSRLALERLRHLLRNDLTPVCLCDSATQPCPAWLAK